MKRISGFLTAFTLSAAATMAQAVPPAPVFNPVRDILAAGGQLDAIKQDQGLQDFCDVIALYRDSDPQAFKAKFDRGNFVPVYVCNAAENKHFLDMTELNKDVDHGVEGATPQQVKSVVTLAIQSDIENSCAEIRSNAEDPIKIRAALTKLCVAAHQPGYN